ncbi:MAG: hypothetical protein QOI50_1199, partial [Pseudonocardiales bacterium]|nr:hypothetical protein [Pseudonocardiales bacterium]
LGNLTIVDRRKELIAACPPSSASW